jgi:hypothetical protein
MFGSLIGKIREAELANAPQPLELGGVDKRDNEPSLGRIRIDPDNVVNRIAVNSFGQDISGLSLFWF